MRRRWSAFAFLMLSVASTAFAQEETDSIGQEIVVAGKVGIKNLADSTRVNFALRATGRDSIKYSLDPGQAKDFRCGPPRCSISLKTRDKEPVSYALQSEKRYGIFWNKQKLIWDIRLVAD